MTTFCQSSVIVNWLWVYGSRVESSRGRHPHMYYRILICSSEKVFLMIVGVGIRMLEIGDDTWIKRAILWHVRVLLEEIRLSQSFLDGFSVGPEIGIGEEWNGIEWPYPLDVKIIRTSLSVASRLHCHVVRDPTNPPLSSPGFSLNRYQTIGKIFSLMNQDESHLSANYTWETFCISYTWLVGATKAVG